MLGPCWAWVQVPLLDGLPDECVGFVVTLLRRADFVEGDVIYQAGGRAEFDQCLTKTLAFDKRLTDFLPMFDQCVWHTQIGQH